MTTMTVFGIASLLVIIGVSIIKVMWDDFKDGVWGKVCLIILIISSYSELDKFFDAPSPFQYNISPAQTWIQIAVAGWLCRHLWLFLCHNCRDRWPWLPCPPTRKKC